MGLVYFKMDRNLDVYRDTEHLVAFMSLIQGQSQLDVRRDQDPRYIDSHTFSFDVYIYIYVCMYLSIHIS